MKIVINNTYGGFHLSPSGEAFLAFKGLSQEEINEPPRNHPALVEMVESLGDVACASCCSLRVVEVPDDVQWQIDDYDGVEWVAEKHRRWWSLR